MNCEVESKYEDPRTQKMCDWFRENYCDPGHGVPYDSGEGGYQYIFGGPYDAMDVLTAQFEGTYPIQIIETLASDLTSECIDWVKKADYPK